MRHAADDVAKKALIRLAHLAVGPEAMLDEFIGDRLGVCAGEFHLIDRLDRGKPRGMARDVLRTAFSRARSGHRLAPSLARTFIKARQARAASPPLSPSPRAARTSACFSFSTVRMPLPIARPCSMPRSISAR